MEATSGLSRDAILAKIAERKREVDPIEIPEWGGSIYILKHLTVDAMEKAGYWGGEATTSAVLVRVLAASIADAEGNPLFIPEDAKALVDADIDVAMRVFREAAKLHGLSNANLEEAVATFAGAQDGASSSE